MGESVELSAKGGFACIGNKNSEGFADETPFFYIQQGGGGLVGVLDYTGFCSDKIAIWGEFK